jgi:hypothetical protein
LFHGSKILSNLIIDHFSSERSHIIGVISWIPISVAFKKQFEAVIHFVGQQLYVSGISILAFFRKKYFYGAFAIRSQSNFCFE